MQQFTGLQYTKIAIANSFGLDKKSWQDRIDWVDRHHHVDEDSMDLSELTENVTDAKEPMQMLGAIQALRDAYNGEPTGFIMPLDATASGLQLYACLMGCHSTAMHTNLINTGKREDAYQNITDKVEIPGITRSVLKPAVMTHYYGSKAEPRSVFGEDTPELAAFYRILLKEFPGAEEALADIQGCWDASAYEYTWTLPDGHTCVMKVMVETDGKIEVDELDHATYTYRADINTPQDFGVALAANTIHSIDGWIVREMLRMAKTQGFGLLTIHDSFH